MTRLRLLHRRLAVLMGLAGLLAFAGGAGFEPLSALLAGAALFLALFWHPSTELSLRLEHVWVPLAMVLVARALWHVFVVGDDVVIPVVDLLLLLLCAESLRSLDAPNDVRLYALSFALLLAATAYRPGILFALAFVAYVIIATVALTTGHLRRKAERYHVRELTLDRSFLVTTGALSGVTLMVSAVVFVAFPRVSRGWAARGETVATHVVGFADEMSLAEHGATLQANPQIVLRVEFPDGRPETFQGLRWRGRSYDRFDGVRWSRSNPLPPASAPTAWYRERWEGGLIRQQIWAAPLDVRVLFALHPVLGIDPDSRIQPLFDNAGDFMYFGSAAPAYTAWSRGAPPDAEALRQAETGFMPARSYYLQLPRLPQRIPELADSLTREHESRYDKAAAIERWLRTEFSYTRELPATARQTGLDYFLFERRAGHCEYFSTAMVVLLRAAGIHARNVNGFLGGQWSEFGQYLAVTQNEAHSWVEVWFPGYGWVPFDPTPAGAGDLVLTQSWMWPGRFLFDALQHRWNKWVLEYNVEAQWNVLDRLSEALEDVQDGGRDARRTPTPGEGGLLGWSVALLVAAAVAAFWVLRRAPGHGPATRLYLRLVAACRRAGVVGEGAVGPLELAERLAVRGHPAARPAREVVDLYVRVRFGAGGLEPEDRRRMREALGEARRRLRSAAGNGKAPAGAAG